MKPMTDARARGFVPWLEHRVMPPLVHLAESPVVVAIQDGVMSAIPFIIVGFLWYFFFPPEKYLFLSSTAALGTVTGGLFGAAGASHNATVLTWSTLGTLLRGIFGADIPAELKDSLTGQALEAFNAGLGVMSLWASFRVAWKLAALDGRQPLPSGLVSLLVFAVTFPLRPLGLHDLFLYLAHGGLFVALLLAWLLAALEPRFDTLVRRRGPEPVWIARLAPSLLAGGIVGALVVLLNFSLSRWTQNLAEPLQINTLVYLAFQPLLHAGDSILVVVVILSMILLTTMGVHGTGVVGSIVLPIWFALLAENAKAAQEGLAIPHIVTPSFMHWCFMGGSGCTLPLCLMMLRARSARLRKLAKVSLLPSLCNINETLTFGIPLIMNPVTVIPFVVCPVLLATLHYLELWAGWWHRTILYVPFVLPAPVTMWMGSGGDWRSFPIFLVDFTLCAAIWYPFFRTLDERTLEQESQAIIPLEEPTRVSAETA